MKLTGTSRDMHRLDLTKPVGTELRGVKLTELEDREVDELKQLVAERGVVFFRDQEMSLDEQVGIGRRLGELHVHPAAVAPEGYPEVMEVHTDAQSKVTAGEHWHSDVSCDEPLPGCRCSGSSRRLRRVGTPCSRRCTPPSRRCPRRCRNS